MDVDGACQHFLPYICWTTPYTKDNVQFSVERLGMIDKIKVYSAADNVPQSHATEKRCVYVIEAPKGVWGVWVCSEASVQRALCCEGYQQEQCERIRDIVKDVEKKTSRDLKVPLCEPSQSGPASVCNAVWLCPARRKGHPTGRAYLDVRKEDMNAWCRHG